MTNKEAKALIEDAMRGVRIIVCDKCNGLGETLSALCPVCDGAGETTTNELEVADEAGS